MDRGTANLQTLVVGIDAACRRVLEPLFEAGATPRLRELVAEGVSAPLESGLPPWTPSAWPSAYTGTNPGKHGVFGFLHFDGYDWEVVNAAHVLERPVWELLDVHGYTSVVVNVPVTSPPGEFDGALIPGYTAPEDPACHPGWILEEVRDAVGDYRVYPPEDDDPAGAHAALARQRGRAFRYLAREFDPEFGFVQFQGTDSIVHETGADLDALRTVYEAVDDAVGDLLETCDPDTVVIASDHGIGPYGGYEFRVNEFLRDRGDVVATTGEGGMPSWGAVRDSQFREGRTGDDAGPGLAGRALSAAARLGITSQRVGRALEAVGLADAVAAHAPESLVRAGSESVDFPDSRAFVRSRIELGVRINLEGREPDGVVAPDEYDAVREDLIRALSSVETPAGRPVFETVCPREAVYSGPALERAPDVVTVPAEFDQFLSAQLRGAQFGEPSEPWNHKRHGIVVLAGAGVRRADLEGAHLFDLAPTILATMDVPADKRMDGSVLAAVDAVGERAYPEPDRPAATDADTRAVEQRLADLGYLEDT